MMRHRYFLLATLLLFSALASPPSTAEMIEGQVLRLESAFSQRTFPAIDTLVIAQWQLQTFQADGGIKSVCVHTELAKTDANGRYILAGFDNPPHVDGFNTRIRLTLRPYKVGFTEYYTDQIGTSDAFKNQHVRFLITDVKSAATRIQYLMRRAKSEHCPQSGTAQRNTAPFFEALYQEGVTLAQNEQEREQLQKLKQMATAASAGVDGQ